MRSRLLCSKFTSVSVLACALAAFPAAAAAQTEQQQVDAAQQAEACTDLTGSERDACLARIGPPPPGDAQEESIVVTGSRIPRANFDTAQPAVVLGAEQIEQRGYTNLGEALDELPAFGVPGNNAVGGQAGAFGAGQTFVNFFGLGDQRTLTVVNGRRFVSSNTASIFGPTGAGSQVDFNVIPSIIADRIETIAVGGAPIYGSDAIAGTVNIITRREYDGFMIDGQYGISERGDAADYRIRGIAGTKFGGDRGSIVVAGEYNKRDGLAYTDRRNNRLNSFFVTPLDPDAPFDNAFIEDRRLPILAETGIPLVYDFVPLSPGQAADFGGFQPSVLDANGNPLRFDELGNLVPIDFGTPTGDLITANGGNGFVLPANLLTPTERYLGTALLQYQVTDNVRLFGEAWYAHSKGTQLRDQPVYNTYLFGAAGSSDGQFIIDIDNPFLTEESRAIIRTNLETSPFAASPDSFFLTRANTDLITGAGATTVELFRFVAGFDGTFDMFGRELTFEAVGNYGKSTTQGRERVLVQQNFENALNAVRDASGNIVCAPGFTNAAIATISSQCAPINPFGQQISQAARDYVTTEADPRAVNDQWVGTVSLSGSLFDVWGGPVGFAIGYEHREESADFDPGLFYFGQVDPADPTGDRTPFGRSVPIDPVSGKFNTDEVFGELTIPLIGPDNNIPLIHRLELNGAIRYIDHSLAGGDPTWTAGASWQPIRDLTFRGNYTRSVRAPAITELFNPTSQIFTTADDPCDARFRASGPNPTTRQANCSADGLPADFNSNIVQFTARGTLQGNTNLENEKANAWTVGAIVRPSFLPGFTLAVDWVDIELKGAIETLDAEQTLEACYDDPSFPTAICDNFVRDANGQVTFIQTGFANAASRKFEGLVAELQWRVPTPFLGAESSFNLGVNYLYNHELETRVGQGDLTTLRRSIGYSKHQATTNLTYKNKGLAWQWQFQYIGKAKNDPDAPPTAYEFPVVDDVLFVNTSVNYDVNQRLRVSFIVDNVFDTKNPFPTTANGGVVTYFDGVRGRYFKVGAGVKF
ncbi:TonB-dependent receptor [Sphingomonas sp. LY54]|uniref:TonB-dependent receptor domain-containing protein n=1 Tax=Sphingomonas sp. LY54 TaxID=3095343 RepID=UPI002D784CB8|nr:TonB-dependent receptor [Sphingomonas sp. LY54]WRP28812.1 TonB-dependent receptor [Sphingomonas sp. LY54]